MYNLILTSIVLVLFERKDDAMNIEFDKSPSFFITCHYFVNHSNWKNIKSSHLQSDWAQGVLQIIFDIEHIEQNALSLEFSFNLDYPVLPGSVNILKWTLFRSPSSSKSLKYDFPMFILNWTWSLLFIEIVNILTVHG